MAQPDASRATATMLMRRIFHMPGKLPPFNSLDGLTGGSAPGPLVDPCDSLTPLRFLDTTRRSGGSPSKLEGVTPPPLAQRIALGLMPATQVATPFHRPG